MAYIYIIYIYVPTYTYIYTYIYSYIYIYVYIYNIYIYTHISIYTYIYIYTEVYGKVAALNPQPALMSWQESPGMQQQIGVTKSPKTQVRLLGFGSVPRVWLSGLCRFVTAASRNFVVAAAATLLLLPLPLYAKKI